jgi:WD40 repeat protein/serine/threonine protein kinase
MIHHPKNVRSIFGRALEIDSPAERAAYLHEACGADAELRREVESLLKAADKAGDFMQQAPVLAVSPSSTVDETPIAEGPGTVIGPYKLMEQIGEGGFGLVFVAEQHHPVRRRVALKIIKPGMDSRQVIARFEAERQALAMMDHQNIAKVYDAGTTASGHPYFVMELVAGIPIIVFSDANRLTLRQRLELFIPVCHAIQHAHQKGIIHRDIKPSNILVTMYDDMPVPKVIDFGVAKAIEQRLTEKTVYTQFGTLVGTFEYMSPEQAEMNAFGVDTRSDIYSLGVLLYELLTGTTPLEVPGLRQAAFGEIVRRIKEEEPPRPSMRLSTSDALEKVAAARKTEPAKLSRLVRGELDWVVMKCLEKNRVLRYESAGILARDIQRYLNGEPVEARPPSAWYRFRKLAGRNKVALMTAALVAAALLLGTAASTWQAFRATAAEQVAWSNAQEALEERLAADDAKKKAEKRSDELAVLNEKLRRLNYLADINLARHDWDENNLVRAWELLERHRPSVGEADLRGFEWYYLRRQFRRDLLTIKAHPDWVTTVAFTPDGKRIVTIGFVESEATYGKPRTSPAEIKLWDAATGNPIPLALNGSTDKVYQGSISPDGNLFAAGCRDKMVRIWSLKTGEQFTLAGHIREFVGSAVFSSDGKYLVSLAQSSYDVYDPVKKDATEIIVWDLATRKPIRTLLLPWWSTFPVISSDGKRLAVGLGEPSLVKIWDIVNGVLLHSYETLSASPLAVAFSPNGQYLAATCIDNQVHILDAGTGKRVHTCMGTGSAIRPGLAFSPDGKWLASAGINSSLVEVWDAENGKLVRTFKGHLAGVFKIAFSPDGTRLASASMDGRVKVWDLFGDPDRVSIPATRYGFAKFMLISPDGRIALTGRFENTACLWDAAAGKPFGKPIKLDHKIVNTDFTGDGKLLALTDDANNVTIWEPTSGRMVHSFKHDCPDKYPITMISLDGKWFALPGPGKVVKVWDVEKGREFRTLKGFRDTPRTFNFSTDSRHLAAADASGVLKIWDLITGQETTTADLKGFFASSISFSPDGRHLAIAGGTRNDVILLRGEIRILDTQTGEELRGLIGSIGELMALAFTPDGRRLAAGNADGGLRLWDPLSGQELLTVQGQKGVITDVRFSPDGRRLISASTDLTVRVLDATPLPE